MTAITQNLPSFVKDLGESIIGEKCYKSLIYNLQFSDAPCLKFAISKALGIAIVAGGSIMKIPQILLITRARSARGLSLAAYTLETLAYGVTVGYSMRKGYAFSTYGENAFLAFQNVLITFLIVGYATPTATSRNSPADKGKKALILSLGGLAFAWYISTCTHDALALLQLATLPLSLLSKLPQIRINHVSKSTGQLSAFAVLSQVLGCLARLFTTAQEVNDILVFAGFFLALILNVVLGLQLWMYWGQDGKILTGAVSEKAGAAAAMEHLNERGLGGGPASTLPEKTSTQTAATNSTRSPATTSQTSLSQTSVHARPAAAALTSEPKASPGGLSSPAPAIPASPSPAAYRDIGRATPPTSRSGTPVSARKWSRKVD